MTRLYLESTHHSELKHSGGRSTLLAEFTKRFHSPQVGNLVRKVVHGCTLCKQLNKKPRDTDQQLMGELPDFRLQPEGDLAQVFQHVGVDAASPFLIKQGRGRARAKRYFLLFTCSSLQ